LGPVIIVVVQSATHVLNKGMHSTRTIGKEIQKMQDQIVFNRLGVERRKRPAPMACPTPELLSRRR
jgi:hypothetical protein